MIKQLFEQLDHKEFKICTSDSPTFLFVDGSSYIDLMIVSSSISDKFGQFHTDEVGELFSGAPCRGHIPLITSIDEHNQKPTHSAQRDFSKI